MDTPFNKQDFYYTNGTPFNGIFKEIPLGGTHNVPEPNKPAMYTIQEQDQELPSAHKIYMASMNEYDAALKLTPSFVFWKQMLKCSVKIHRLILSWREEKMLRDQAEARRLLWVQAQKGSVPAQKILYESKKEEAEQRKQKTSEAQEDLRQQHLAEATISRLKVIK